MNSLPRWYVVLLLLAVPSSAAPAAAWSRGYGPLQVSSVKAVAALSKEGAAVLSDGFKNVVFTVDAKGDVLRAKEFPQQLVLLAARDAIFGVSMSGSAPFELRVVKLDAAVLSTQWANRFMPSTYWVPNALIATRDGGAAVAGTIGAASFVLRIAADGQLLWAKTLDASGDDRFQALVETRDGGIVAAGSMNQRRPWLVKLSKDGSLGWQSSYEPGCCGLLAVAELPDGDLVASGREPFVMRLSSVGELKWQKGISRGDIDRPRSIVSLGGGAVAISLEPDTGQSTGVVALNADGTVRWQRRFTPVGAERGGGALAMADLTATANGTVLYGPQLHTSDQSRSTMLFALAMDGATGCRWFSPLNLQFADTNARAETLTVDIQPLPLETAKWDMVSTAITLQASDQPCPGAAGTVPEAPAAVSEPALASFNSARAAHEKALAWYELLKAKQFAKLDEIAAGLRANPRGDADPIHWDIHAFYDTMITTHLEAEEVVLQRLRDWQSARPDSVTARIALASALHRAAWKRRGNSYADDVTSAGWKEYRSLLAESAKTLGAVRGAEKDPYYWVLQSSHAIESAADVREVVRRAARYTDDPELFHGASNGLLPKWGGSVEEYRAFAEEAATLTRATYGEALYMWLAYQAKFQMTAEEYASAAFDWKRVQQGARDLIRIAPAWLPSYHRFALLARRFNDRAVAREMFQRPELVFYEDAIAMWRTRQAYDDVRDWALRPEASAAQTPATQLKQSSGTIDASPLLSRAPEDWPQVAMQNTLTIAGTKHEHLASFLVETPRGVVALSSVPTDREALVEGLNLLQHAERRLSKWTMASPKQPGRVMTVQSFDTKNAPNTQRAVALALAPAKGELPVHVLKLHPQRRVPQLGERVFIVGCRWTGTTCTQIVLQGELFSGFRGDGRVSHTVGLKEAHDPAMLGGSAMLDEDGYVFAVVGDLSAGTSSEFTTLLGGDDLGTVISP